MNQTDTLTQEQAVALIVSQSRAFAAEFYQDGSRGTSRGAAALEYDLAVAQIQVLGRRGLLPAGEGETVPLVALLLQPSDPAMAALEVPIEYSDLDVPALNVSESSLELLDIEPITMTEVGTKLDLARAYLDAGDPERARIILEEVLQVESEAKEQISELTRELEKARG
jgi:FimV-like protein